MGARPTIVRNPATDRAFEAAIEAALESGVLEPAAFEQQLRKRYPQLVVHRRELAGETTPVWYVYRDGRWTAGD